MAFLSPWFFIALAATLIPLVMHLLRREKPTTIAFSSLRFFKKTSRALALFQRIQKWLLLLLRMLIVALLAVAFTRPFLQTELSRLTTLTPEATVVLLDRSMSMQYGDNFELAIEATMQIIDRLEPGDEAAIVTFSDNTEVVLDMTDDFVALKRFVSQLAPPEYRGTRYLPPLRLADQMLLAGSHPKKRVVLISDFQQQGISQFDADWKLTPGVNFNSVLVGEEAVSNLAITDVRSPTNMVREEDGFVILARTRNMGTAPIQSADVSLTIDGEEVSSQTVDLSGRSEAVARFHTRFASGSHTGRISVEDDSFQADNHFYFTIDVMPKISVLVVNGESSEQWYADESHWLRLALGGNNKSQFQTQTTVPGDLDPGDLQRYDVIVLLNTGTLRNDQYRGLGDYARAGGSLLLAVADNVESGEYNRGFAGITPALLEDRYRSFTDDYLVIADVNRRHPLFKTMGGSDWSAHIQSYWPSKPVAESEILMRYDNGAPALLEARPGEGRVLLFTTSLDTEWNNLPLHSLYLPFVHEMLHYLTMRQDKRRYYLVGDTVPLGEHWSDSLTITDPGGDEQFIELDDGATPLYRSADQPGIYTIQSDSSSTGFAVNSRTEESDFTAIEPHEIGDKVINPSTRPEPSRQALDTGLDLKLEKSQRLWWWFLLLVLLLSAAESVISNRTYR